MMVAFAMTHVHNVYKNLISDTIDCVNIMYPAEAISVGNNALAESLIVGPVFFKAYWTG